MPRYRLTIEYDGTQFCGWQFQKDQPTVQGVLAAALSTINGEPVSVIGAGRTDAGVHATGQVAHVDLIKPWSSFTIINAINANVRPHRIAVTAAEIVDDSFSARFSASRRHYLYRIHNRRSPPALDHNRAWWVPVELDAEAMHDAAQVLVGHHDFTTFRSSECQSASPVKTLDHLQVSRRGGEIEITTHARSFLHNQVRSMVGSLRNVGEGRWSKADLKSALEARDRTSCGPVAAACGLYLTRVEY
jgi:tRNA pseudouridine38-40 synthase